MNNTELQRVKQRYNIVGNCNALNRALDVALQVAPTDLSVLIVGESGVGKEIIPRVIHDNSPRKRENISPLTAALYQKVRLIANSLDTKRVRSQGPLAKAMAILVLQIGHYLS